MGFIAVVWAAAKFVATPLLWFGAKTAVKYTIITGVYLLL